METLQNQASRLQELQSLVPLIQHKQNGCRRLYLRSREVYDQLKAFIAPNKSGDGGNATGGSNTGALSYEVVLLVQDYVR